MVGRSPAFAVSYPLHLCFYACRKLHILILEEKSEPVKSREGERQVAHFCTKVQLRMLWKETLLDNCTNDLDTRILLERSAFSEKSCVNFRAGRYFGFSLDVGKVQCNRVLLSHCSTCSSHRQQDQQRQNSASLRDNRHLLFLLP